MIVNQELSEIFNSLTRVIKICNSNTVVTAVTFHSLEDRIVKKFLISVKIQIKIRLDTFQLFIRKKRDVYSKS